MKRTISFSVIPWLVFIAVLVLTVSVSWQTGKKLSYKFAYKSMVEQTVKDMVKPEALK